MRTATGGRRLAPHDDYQTLWRWRLGSFIALLGAILIALSAFTQPPAKPPIRPTGPLPAVNIP